VRSHHIAVINRHRTEQVDGGSCIYGNPRNRFVADVIGSVDLHGATVTSTHTTFCIDCVAIIVRARPARMDGSMFDAAGAPISRASASN